MSNNAHGPSKILLSLEPIRGISEYGLSWLMNVPLKSVCHKGDGHPVLVFPGLGGGDGTTQYLRMFLNDIGYNANPWKLGRNLGPRKGMEAMITSLEDRLRQIYEGSGNQQVSVIGWSLGGIYAREVAKRLPDMVRQVITLGTPFKATAGGTNAAGLYEVLSGDNSHKDPNVMAEIAIPPSVPFTSIYSKTDGVVHWECSLEDSGHNTENIEIPGASHMGLGHNPIAMYLISHRLQNTRDTWVPYKP
jgi:hypothetical protein